MRTSQDMAAELMLMMKAQLTECRSTDVVDMVVTGVCRALEVNKTDIKSATKSTALVEARYIIMNVLYNHHKMSLKSVGAVLGGRDHATVIAGVRKFQSLIDAKDKAFLHKINLVIEELGESCL